MKKIIMKKILIKKVFKKIKKYLFVIFSFCIKNDMTVTKKK